MKQKTELSANDKKKLKAAKAEQDRLKKLAAIQEEQMREAERYVHETREFNLGQALLIDSIKSFDAMYHAYLRAQTILMAKKKWNDYVNCLNLPSPVDIQNLRAYLDAWQQELITEYESRISWVIDVEPRSMLTQDISAKNLTFKKLWSEQPWIGDSFTRRLKNANYLLEQMELAINAARSLFVKTELIEIRDQYRQQFKVLVDLFAFRLLTNVEYDMIRIDPYSAMHDYQSDLFRASIWTTRPVPQIHKYWLTETDTVVEFPIFGTTFTCPEHIEIEGYAFRALWTAYDHYSDYAPSYTLKVDAMEVHDLKISNKEDWLKMEELRETKLNEMMKRRADWEEADKARIAAEEAALLNKKNLEKGKVPAKKAKKSKKMKAMPEPPVVTKDTIVNIDEEFKKYDDEEYTKRQELTSPESLNLTENEINLRFYQLVGGIFQFNHIKRPAQYDRICDHTLLKVGDWNGTALEFTNFNQQYKRDSNFHENLIEIRIQLSDKVAWWTAPIIAFWEPWEQSSEFEQLSPELQDFHINYNKYLDKIHTRLFAQPKLQLSYDVIKCIRDFTVNEFPKEMDFAEFVKFYLIPRIPLSYKFKSEVEEEREIKRKQMMRLKEIEMERLEEKERQRRSFEDEMRVLREIGEADRKERLDKMRAEMQEQREMDRIKLTNQGEQEKQVEKHLKFREQSDENYLHDLEMDEISKFNDFYEDQFNLRFNLEASEEEVLTHLSMPQKTAPIDFYPTYSKQLPLKIKVNNDNDLVCFDCPITEDKNCDVLIIEPELNTDSMLMSHFFKYLKILHNQSIPRFPEQKRIGGPRESIHFEDVSQKIDPNMKKRLSETTTKLKKEKGKKPPPKRRKSIGETIPSVDKYSMDSSEGLKRSRRGPSISGPSENHSDAKEAAPRHVRKPAPPMKLIPHAVGKWRTSGIYFPEYDPETRELKFLTSHWGTFGMGLPKYCNYPLKNWELYPNATKKLSVMLKIIGNFCEVKIEITEDGYYIERIAPNKINFEPNKTPMTYEEMRTYLSESGILNFPNIDAPHYINGCAQKHNVMERHTYNCIAQFVLTYYFRWSQFNAQFERRSIVFEMYQLHETETVSGVKSDVAEFEEILVTNQRCNTVKIAMQKAKDGTVRFVPELVPAEQDFYADTLLLLIARSHDISLKKHVQMKNTFRYNVARLLCAIKPFSFSI